MVENVGLKSCGLVLVAWVVWGLGCNQFVTVYWSKPGAGNAELQRDKDECQSLQRAVGLKGDRIEKCLEAKGWSQVKREPGSPDSQAHHEQSDEVSSPTEKNGNQ